MKKIGIIAAMMLLLTAGIFFWPHFGGEAEKTLKATYKDTDQAYEKVIRSKTDREIDSTQVKLVEGKSAPQSTGGERHGLHDDLPIDEYMMELEKLLSENERNDPAAHAEAALKARVSSDERESLGYFSEDAYRSYSSYSDDVLLGLAEEGDILAIQSMADRYLSVKRDRAAALAMDMLGVIHGSAWSATSMARAEQSEATGRDMSLPEARQQALKALAWYRVAERLGDKQAALQSKTFSNVSEIQLSASDLEHIDQIASEIVTQVSKIRVEKYGLSSIDASDR